MFLKPALGEVKVRGFELPLDLYVILRDELLRPPAETPRAQGTTHLGNARRYTHNKYTGSGSRSPGLKPLFEQERRAVEWFLVPSRLESREGAVGLHLPGVDGVGELELQEAPDFVAVSPLARGDKLLDPAVQVALHEVDAAEVDLLFLALPEGKRAGVFQEAATSETTRMFSLIPSRPSLRQQMPRMMRSIPHPGLRRFVERLDDPRVRERVHLARDQGRLTFLHLLSLLLDEARDALA
jgi:hypothetical protein